MSFEDPPVPKAAAEAVPDAPGPGRSELAQLRALGELAGGVAHDLNNLLTTILSAAELIEWEVEAGSPIRLKLAIVIKAVMRARDLNRQLVAFQLNGGPHEPLDFTAVAREACRLFRASFPPSVEVRSSLAPDLWVLGEGGQLHQVILNLAINALQAMQPGSGTLEVVLVERSGRAILRVRDSGCGIEPETLPHIFEPFFTTKNAQTGKGLGLAVVQGIIRKHAGTISVASEPGKGCTFQVSLPCIAPPAGLRFAQGEAQAGGRERMLLVEDEARLNALNREGLES